MLISIKSIQVIDRYRKDFGDLNSLAASIAQHGQLHNIVVEPTSDGEYRLVAGERRLRAMQILKLDHIEASFREQLSPLERLEIELEENLHRKEMEWPEEVALKAKIHEVKQLIAGDRTEGRSSGKWTVVDTAQLLGESKSLTAHDLDLAKAILQYPELLTFKSKDAAFKRFKQLEIERLQRMLTAKQRAKGKLSTNRIFLGNCCEILKQLPESSVHLVIVDPPYGVDITELSTSGTTHTAFQDDQKHALQLIDEMLTQLNRVMAINSSIYMFFGIVHYQAIIEMLKKHFTVDPVPLIWYKTSLGGGRTMAPDIHQCRTYEAIFYARKGTRALIKQGQENVLSYDVVTRKQKLHLTEKPIELLKELIVRSSIEEEIVLDPCCGSGSTLMAAKELKREWLGIELDEHYYNVTCSRLII